MSGWHIDIHRALISISLAGLENLFIQSPCIYYEQSIQFSWRVDVFMPGFPEKLDKKRNSQILRLVAVACLFQIEVVASYRLL